MLPFHSPVVCTSMSYINKMCFIGSIFDIGRVFKGLAGLVSWGSQKTAHYCCFLSCGRGRKWGRSLPQGRKTQMKTCRWCWQGCKSPQVCTGAQSHWWKRGGAPSPELCRGCWTGQPLALSALSPSPSSLADPETPPEQRLPGLSWWPCCGRRWWWRRSSLRLRWRLAGWKW